MKIIKKYLFNKRPLQICLNEASAGKYAENICNLVYYDLLDCQYRIRQAILNKLVWKYLYRGIDEDDKSV